MLYMHVCIHECIYSFYMNVCIPIYPLNVLLCMYVCIFVCIYECIYTYICIHICNIHVHLYMYQARSYHYAKKPGLAHNFVKVGLYVFFFIQK